MRAEQWSKAQVEHMTLLVGEAKKLEARRLWLMGTHDLSCACEECVTMRAAVRETMDEDASY